MLPGLARTLGAETMLWASDATWGAETIRCRTCIEVGEGPASRCVKDLHCSSVSAMMDVGTTYIASWSPLKQMDVGTMVGGVSSPPAGQAPQSATSPPMPADHTTARIAADEQHEEPLAACYAPIPPKWKHCGAFGATARNSLELSMGM